jgi:hypothetical protein
MGVLLWEKRGISTLIVLINIRNMWAEALTDCSLIFDCYKDIEMTKALDFPFHISKNASILLIFYPSSFIELYRSLRCHTSQKYNI